MPVTAGIAVAVLVLAWVAVIWVAFNEIERIERKFDSHAKEEKEEEDRRRRAASGRH